MNNKPNKPLFLEQLQEGMNFDPSEVFQASERQLREFDNALKQHGLEVVADIRSRRLIIRKEQPKP